MRKAFTALLAVAVPAVATGVKAEEWPTRSPTAAPTPRCRI